jgi:ribose 5-phosphate isomerase B
VRVAVAFDHRGVALRSRVLAEVEALGHEVVDRGTDAAFPRIDYPDKARDLGDAIVSGRADRGILVCSTGVGAAIAACKVDGVRAAVCHDVYTAHQGVEHDDMNVLCLGSEIIGGALAAELIGAFLAAEFDGGERYVQRLRKVAAMERNGSPDTPKGAPVRIQETFDVNRPPEAVFDYLTNPSSLPEWQTAKTSVEQLTDGAPGPGTRFRERTKGPGGKEFEQVVEFTEFDRPRRVNVHVVEGPYPVDGTWTFEPDGTGTHVAFVAEGTLRGAMRPLQPLVQRMVARQFAAYHRNLRRNLEAAPAS